MTGKRLCKWISSGGWCIGGEAHEASRQTARRGNPMNPRVGSRMQQACELSVEQAVEVVQNHEDGTRGGLGSLTPKAPRSAVSLSREVRSGHGRWEWTPKVMSTEGKIFGQPWRSCSATSQAA